MALHLRVAGDSSKRDTLYSLLLHLSKPRKAAQLPLEQGVSVGVDFSRVGGHETLCAIFAATHAGIKALAPPQASSREAVQLSPEMVSEADFPLKTFGEGFQRFPEVFRGSAFWCFQR